MISAIVGCDTGGTFTDFVLLDESCPQRGLLSIKVPSTPDEPARAVFEGLRLLEVEAVLARLCHATTVATNTILEGSLARVAYIVSAGFADSLWLGRGERSRLYSLWPRPKLPPLRREDVWEVNERVSASGDCLQPLKALELASLVEQLKDRSDIQAVAICFLHSPLYPAHELRVADALASLSLPVFCSHKISPALGEYERGMTTLLAAALAPKIDTYLESLEEGVGRSRLWVIGSAGGQMTPAQARGEPQRLALSGPAAGLRGAVALARAHGVKSILTLDIGGTSSDLSLCQDLELPYAWQAKISGFPLLGPTLEIHTIGAGGGSIAFVDEGGLLKVGPRSAGSEPGPACYGKGGAEPTLSDALCYAGYLPSKLGQLELDVYSCERVLTSLAQEVGLSVLESALGIVKVAVGHLGIAARKVSTGRGRDPREFTLMPFGGAGPMLACWVAQSLDMEAILLSHQAGVLSAYGALISPWENEWSTPVSAHSRSSAEAIERTFKELESSVRIAKEIGPYRLERLVARRYRGQGDALVSPPSEDFHRLHRECFGFERLDTEVETVEVRLRARSSTLSAPLAFELEPSWVQLEVRTVLSLDGHKLDIPVFEGVLEEGRSQKGPFLYFNRSSTAFVDKGWQAMGLRGGDLLLSKCDFKTKEDDL